MRLAAGQPGQPVPAAVSAGRPVHSMPPESVELRNGVRMPILGLGTSHSGGYSHSTVVYALQECGYRLIDTAKRYGCEEFLHQAIRDSGVAREDLFLITKLWPRDYGSLTTRQAFEGSLQRLGVDYLDMFMMHWPECPSSCPDRQKVLDTTWRQLELLYDEGLCRAIGVSNYEKADLEPLLESCSVVPHANQVECHPYHFPQDLLAFCDQHGIQFQGYSPLGKGKLIQDPEVLRVARSCGRTPAQVLVRWSIQNNVVAIPKSTKKYRVKENSQVFDFKLSAEDMESLNRLHRDLKYVQRCGIQQKIDSDLPDGYKLQLPNAHDQRLSVRNYS
ncbi:putative oxidoreductase ZK1290.5 [Ixodes scapularis]